MCNTPCNALWYLRPQTAHDLGVISDYFHICLVLSHGFLTHLCLIYLSTFMSLYKVGRAMFSISIL